MNRADPSPALVSDPAEVTPEWLTAVLAHAGALLDGRVIAFESESVGTGQVGANIRYRLRYESPPVDAPSSVVAKFASADDASRATGIATLTYETEVAFYRDLASTVDISRPHCYFAAIEAGTANVVLVLEDLSPAEQGDQLAGCTLAQAELAMVEAARLHGPRWGDPTLLEHRWLVDRVGASTGIADLYRSLFGGFVDRYRATLDGQAIAVGERLGGGIEQWSSYRPPGLTITHGDYRLDNMLFATQAGGRPLTVVDWQTVRLGCGTADVAYFLGAGLDPATRRDHERELVVRYHDAVVAYGVEDYPRDACWEDYRRYSYSGYLMAVIASMLVGRTERGDAMFMTMANGHAAQVVDLGADEFVR
jgi:hypothetical protein